MMKKLVIIDEYLRNKSGHYYEYDKSVKEIFQGHNIAVAIYAHEKLESEIKEELTAIPYLKGLPKNSLNKIPVLGQMVNRISFIFSLYKKLREIYRSEQEPGTVFFFTNVVWYNVLPVALAASASKHKSAILYRFSIFEHIGLPKSLYKLGSWLYRYSFKKLLRNDNILFFTDSDVIADECNARFHCNMQVLPIPHLKEDALPAPLADRPDIFKLYLPGHARQEKGIAFITQAFEHMEAIRHPLLKKIVLTTQNAEDTIKKRLEQLPFKNNFLNNLSSEDYQHQLDAAHIMLIAYDAEQYRARTSGIVSETIAASKPFITTRNSWMSFQSEKYKTGLSITYNAIQEFTDALQEVIQNYAIHQERAIRAREAWLAFHSKENFYNIFINQYKRTNNSAK